MPIDVFLDVRCLETDRPVSETDRGKLSPLSKNEDGPVVLAENLADLFGRQEGRKLRHAKPPSELAPPGAALPEVRRCRQPVACE